MEMAEKSMLRRAPLDREVDQAIVALKKGAHLLKCGRRGKPKFCPFRLSTDEKVLIWYSGDREKQLKLKCVSKIILGQKTVNFLRQPQPEKESQSFSLIYQNGERSLDLICKDREQAESWCLGLTALLAASLRLRPLAKLRISRGARSCASSPVGHVHRKYRLGLVNASSPKSLQVRSLHSSPPRSLLEGTVPDSVFDLFDISYSSRQRKFSDMLKDSDTLKDHKIILTPKNSSSCYGSRATDKAEALKDVFMWGEGISRLLHDEISEFTNMDFNSDALVPKLLHSTRLLEVDSISCGEKHAALITKQGEAFCWGQESGGRLGHKINIDVPYPKAIESLNGINVQSMSCGSHHTCAVTISGELYSWGVEHTNNSRNWWFPQKVRGPLDGICVSMVACGQWHTAIITSSGQLFTYGDGTFGVLGHGDLQSVSQPKEVESLKGLRVKSVACGPWHTAAVVGVITGRFKSNAPGGKLFTWGDGDKGRLGHSDKDRKLIPTCVASLVDCDFVQVSCGRELTVALTATGIVFTMGSMLYGQDHSVATIEGCLMSEIVREISAGSYHVAALTTKGKVFTWGKGENGRLGLGDTRDRSHPMLVEALEDRYVHTIACGSSFTAAICSHKSISSKDQLICSSCQMVFGFTRKKHNCYNCGLVFCHSCSSKKALNAPLAPNKGKKYRVCDPCFSRMQRLQEPKTNEQLSSPRKPPIRVKGNSDVKTVKEEAVLPPPKRFLPKIYSEDNKPIEGNTASSRGRNQHCEDSFSPFVGKTQRWGQVPCPLQFSKKSRENSSLSAPGEQVADDYHAHAHTHARTYLSTSLTLVPKAGSLKQDLTEIDKMLSEELKRLQAEAMLLTEICQAKSLKLSLNKRRIEDTWSLAKDEAAKCKAAKDVIKILTNQMNALSEKLSAGTKMNKERCTPDEEIYVSTPRPPQREASQGMRTLNSIISGKVDANQHQSEDITLEDLRQSAPKLSRDEWVEQDEAGVYITFIVLPNGQKGLKRVRFSRRRFSDKEAERWWEENQRRVYLKYNVERIVSSNRNKVDH